MNAMNTEAGGADEPGAGTPNDLESMLSAARPAGAGAEGDAVEDEANGGAEEALSDAKSALLGKVARKALVEAAKMRPAPPVASTVARAVCASTLPLASSSA